MYPEIEAKLRKSSKEVKPGFLRRSGWIPGVVFGKGVPSVAIKIEEPKLETLLKKGESVVEITIEGKKKQLVNLTKFDRNILNRKLIHVAFHILKAGEKTTLIVPIVLVGEALGVKDGGIVSQVLNEVSVKCLPKDAPSSLELDISNLQFDANLTFESLKISTEVELVVEKLNETIVTCKAPKKEKVVEPVAASEVEVTAQGEDGDPAAKPEDDKKPEKKDEKKS